jgi:hypothetical protein
MIDLGTTRAPSTLQRVTLSLDEMDLLLDRLQIDELPVVLSAVPRFDNKSARDAAFAHAESALEERGLIAHGEVHPDLADRLAILGHPHWVVALRLFGGESISRLCLTKGAESTVLALRGPESYVIDDAGPDLAGVVLAALGPAEALGFESFSAPTAELSELFNDALVELGVQSGEDGAVLRPHGARRNRLRRRNARTGRRTSRRFRYTQRSIRRDGDTIVGRNEVVVAQFGIES